MRVLLMLVMVPLTIGAACERLPDDASAVCEFESQGSRVFSQLEDRPLPSISSSSSPSEVAAYGRQGEASLTALVADWSALDPPTEAVLWHASVEEWLTTMSGGFAILTAAEGRSNAAVTSVVDSFMNLSEGMMYEWSQLETQAQLLFEDC